MPRNTNIFKDSLQADATCPVAFKASSRERLSAAAKSGVCGTRLGITAALVMAFRWSVSEVRLPGYTYPMYSPSTKAKIASDFKQVAFFASRFTLCARNATGWGLSQCILLSTYELRPLVETLCP